MNDDKDRVDEVIEALANIGEAKQDKPKVVLPDFADPKVRARLRFPNDHRPVTRVPPGTGGARCSTCIWLKSDKSNCANPYYKGYMQTKLLPWAPEEMCSDWWEPKVNLE